MDTTHHPYDPPPVGVEDSISSPSLPSRTECPPFEGDSLKVPEKHPTDVFLCKITVEPTKVNKGSKEDGHSRPLSVRFSMCTLRRSTVCSKPPTYYSPSLSPSPSSPPERLLRLRKECIFLVKGNKIGVRTKLKFDN